MTTLTVETRKKREVVDITAAVSGMLANEGMKNGLVNIFAVHTTAAITTADLDPGGTDQDYLNAFDKIVPQIGYRHPHDPAHMPDHILSALIGASLTLPVAQGKLVLGTWQRVVLMEFDGPRERTVIVTAAR